MTLTEKLNTVKSFWCNYSVWQIGKGFIITYSFYDINTACVAKKVGTLFLYI